MTDSQAPTPFRVAATILAAGASVRMGLPKLLLPWGGTSVLGHLLQQWRALGSEQIAVVCSSTDHPIRAEFQRLGFPDQDMIVNPTPEKGMFSSIQSAARWGGWKKSLTHWAIALGDQPHLREATLRMVLECGASQPEKIWQPAHGGRRGHPVLLPRPVFARLGASPATTLKEFLAQFEVAACEVDDPGLKLDLDRPEDYQRALDMAGY